MKFSPQQDRALHDVARWLHARNSQVYRLFGYAGTGKTTLAKYIAAHADGRVLFAAYTGKAAHVMRRKGCEGASTLHHLIYRCINTEDGPLFKLNRDSPLAGAALLIVDECSMVDAQLGADILSFGVPVLVLGDPAQLPPIGGNAGFFTEATPDILLTDIHRQARDNPIIRMATTVREGGYLAVGDYAPRASLTSIMTWSPSFPASTKFWWVITLHVESSTGSCAISSDSRVSFLSRVTGWCAYAISTIAVCSTVQSGPRAMCPGQR